MACVIGIDPGLTGAVAIVRPPADIQIISTPVVKVEKHKHEYDVHGMWAILEALGPGAEVSLEKQWAQVRQTSAGPRREGVTQSFRLGWGYGLWTGLVIAARHALYPVAPVTWKKHFGLFGKTKQAGKLVIAQRVPAWGAQHALRKVSDGAIDALLLALYRLEQIENGGTHGRSVATDAP